jgi:hypothetical protein
VLLGHIVVKNTLMKITRRFAHDLRLKRHLGDTFPRLILMPATIDAGHDQNTGASPA